MPNSHNIMMAYMVLLCTDARLDDYLDQYNEYVKQSGNPKAFFTVRRLTLSSSSGIQLATLANGTVILEWCQWTEMFSGCPERKEDKETMNEATASCSLAEKEWSRRTGKMDLMAWYVVIDDRTNAIRALRSILTTVHVLGLTIT